MPGAGYGGPQDGSILIDRLGRLPGLALIVVTHHVREIPVCTTHILDLHPPLRSGPIR